MANTPNDPASFFRDMLGQWEKMANSFGAEAMKSEEFTRGMNSATAASANTQAAIHQGMEKWLGASNMPSRKDIEDLSARLAGVEAALARIEAKLGGPARDPAKPRPTRGRKPPSVPKSTAAK